MQSGELRAVWLRMITHAAGALERVGRALGLTADKRGLIRLGIYLTLVYLLFTTYPGRADRALRHVYNWFGVSAFLVLFGRGYQQIRALEARGERPLGVLAVFFVAFAATALFIRPFHSSDLHAYVNVGHIQHHYGLNPYVSVPADLDWRADPMFAGQWKDVPCTYGFLYAAICHGIAALGAGDPQTTRLLFKLLGVLAITLCAWLMESTRRRMDRPPSIVPLYLILWNPYVLLHFVSHAHNDLLMALCLLVAFHFAIRKRWLWVIPALIAGMLVKHVAFVAVPFAFVFLVRRFGWSRAILGALFGLACIVPAAWPYVLDWSDFRWDKILGLLTSPWNSIQGAIGTLYEWLGGLVPALAASTDAFRDGLRFVFAAGFLAFAAHRFFRAAVRRDYDAPDVIEDSLVTLFVLLCICSSAWLPWYLGMFFPAVFLLPRGHWVRRLTVWIAAFQMLAFTGVGKARVLQAGVMLVLPMALYWYLHRRRRGSAREATKA